MHHSARRRLRGVLSALHTLDTIRRIVLNLLFWLIIAGVIVAIIASRPPRVKKGSILVVSPYGALVDNYTLPVSFAGLPIGRLREETVLSDLITALDTARTDEKIAGLWLRLDNLTAAGSAAAGELAEAVRRFTLSGKPSLAGAHTYNTPRYRIASAADVIIVDRLGEVFPAGYGSWRPYYAEGLEKIGVQPRLFRSGESKSAAEGFMRSEMSDEARSDARRLLGDLWDEWLGSVSAHRGIPRHTLTAWIDAYDDEIIAVSGDGSRSALGAGLVDAVETGGVVQERLERLFGENAPRIDALDYARRRHRGSGADGTVAVVPIAGTLVFGGASRDFAGSDDIIAALKSARDSPGVGALVLRIDSPGGDVRAGEAVRRVIQETREQWNIPVVTSMGSLAASGGYWIALESDYIITRPETITGSIGVFALSLRFQKGLEELLGIRIDGVGTTPWSGIENPGRSMDERTAALYRSSVNDIDTLFRRLVSEKRGLTPEDVGALAGGIPWSGIRAVSLGLADELGGLDDARRKAAALAGMERWGWRIFDGVSPSRPLLISRLLHGTLSPRRPVGHARH